MLRLWIIDNTNGSVHEYGDNCHDALCLMEDGSLHYENLQNSTGTMCPEEGYSFCNPDGTAISCKAYENYVDVGGDSSRRGKITVGQILDLIDNSRESEEMVNIMNCDNIREVKAMVCSKLWRGLEDREVNRIYAEGSELYIWLED